MVTISLVPWEVEYLMSVVFRLSVVGFHCVMIGACCCISLAGAATSIIFVATNKVLSRQNILLSRQKTCFVAANTCLSRQNFFLLVAAPATDSCRHFFSQNSRAAMFFVPCCCLYPSEVSVCCPFWAV